MNNAIVFFKVDKVLTLLIDF